MDPITGKDRMLIGYPVETGLYGVRDAYQGPRDYFGPSPYCSAPLPELARDNLGSQQPHGGMEGKVPDPLRNDD